MILRTEYPNPQFERENWQNLNGEWEFLIDYSKSGKERSLYKNDVPYHEKINVPFCPESKLSGIGMTDFMESVWYRKKIEITKEQLRGRVFLNFGAVDYEATVYVNEKEVGSHKGGFVSFKFDITDYLSDGENIISVNAEDVTRSGKVPSGKQSDKFESYGCYYTRTTGIWQTVWLEFTSKCYINKARYSTDVNSGILTVTADLKGAGEFSLEAFFEGRSVGKASLSTHGGVETLSLALSEKHLWEVGDGKLYDLVLTFGEDKVKSYFGLRTVTISKNRVLINGKSVFQRLVLDQGFFPDGIYTAPTEEALVADIERSLAMGFNGARLHQKVFEPRFLYHADRLGYIVWGEYPSWGVDHTDSECIYSVIPEWLEVMARDINHPSIITWCPFNEAWDIDGKKQYDDFFSTLYKITKSADPTRPCIDTSGVYHVMTDIFDLHDYEQDPKEFTKHYQPLSETGDTSDFETAFKNRQKYDGKMPFCVSEYGGIAWGHNTGWGYGNAPKTEEEFLERFKELTHALLDNESIFSLCYTQLTDVEQEQNGLYFYDRTPKFKPEIIKEILSKKAKIED